MITDIEPEKVLDIYQQRMKIELKFCDLKSIFQLDTIINKSKYYLDLMIALMLITYAIAVMIGGAIRDVRYAQVSPDQLDFKQHPDVPQNSRWYAFSSLIVVLRQKRRLSHVILRKIVSKVFAFFSALDSDLLSQIETM